MAGMDRAMARAWRVDARKRVLAHHEQLCQEFREWIRRVNRSHIRRILRAVSYYVNSYTALSHFLAPAAP
ncbi:hypothetical protein GPALN_015051 [Globodera pallida]|nr:hypothetical protein GPALN_015051 [Globodera pallida]